MESAVFILEEPYVSDLLAATVAELGLPVLDTPMARRRLCGPRAMSLSTDDGFAAAAWPAVVTEVEREAQALVALYPPQVLGLDRFVVEEVIEGEELAIDAYSEADGTAVLVDVYAHLFVSADDVSDRVYFTNAETVARLGPPAMELLAEIGRRAGLVDFQIHAELRMDDAGRVAPIELNPMRFGGWCATDLAHFAYGVNPYRGHLLGERLD